jgi:hypothetical protein
MGDLLRIRAIPVINVSPGILGLTFTRIVSDL